MIPMRTWTLSSENARSRTWTVDPLSASFAFGHHEKVCVADLALVLALLERQSECDREFARLTDALRTFEEQR